MKVICLNTLHALKGEFSPKFLQHTRRNNFKGFNFFKLKNFFGVKCVTDIHDRLHIRKIKELTFSFIKRWKVAKSFSWYAVILHKYMLRIREALK